MKTLLIADDNLQIVNILKGYAQKENYEVYTAKNGKEALREFQRRRFDAVLLDVMMPELDGFEVCKKIRETSMVPIIMITARGEDYDRIMGLDIGADDYVIKPFSPSEVMARLRAILRRVSATEMQEEHIKSYGNLKIDMDKFKVFVAGEEVFLTKKEVEILWMLASNKGLVFTRTQILDAIWGYDYLGDSRTVDTHIKRLRAKLDKQEHKDWNIVTVRGVGYRFEVQYE